MTYQWLRVGPKMMHYARTGGYATLCGVSTHPRGHFMAPSTTNIPKGVSCLPCRRRMGGITAYDEQIWTGAQ